MQQALVVIDIQKAVLKDIAGSDEVVQRINKRIQEFRQLKQPVIFIQHEEPGMESGSVGWEFDSQLEVQPDDIVVAKTHADSFYKTDFQQVLDNNHVTDLEICGAQTNFCLDTTIRVAFDRGYKIKIGREMYMAEDNEFMSADQVNAYYALMWDGRFAEVYD